MNPLSTFSFRIYEGPQSSRELESELLLNGDATGKRIPGYILEAQYRCPLGYVFITSWDCGDDSLDVILTDENLQVLDRKSIGAMYDSTLLESHEVLSENEVLLHCDNGFLIRVTVGDGLVLHQRYGGLKEFIPSPGATPAKKNESKPWWKFW